MRLQRSNRLNIPGGTHGPFNIQLARGAMKRDELLLLLNKDEVRGRVIKDAASLEDALGMALMFYFTTNQRHESFEELVLPRLGLNDKLSILEKLPYRRRYKSLGAFKLIRQLQRIRNILAHRSYVSDHRKVLNIEDWAYLFEDWPRTYDTTVKNARRYLGRLINSNEFLDHFAPNRRSYIAQQNAQADGHSSDETTL